jgi:hypothetical protein
MKEYFLVNKDIENIRSEDGKWQDISPSAIKKAAKITTKMVTLCRTEEEAIASTKQEIRGEKETDFFPYFRVEVADEIREPKNLKFKATDVKVTHFTLSHVDESYAAYDNVAIATLGKNKIKPIATSTKEIELPAASVTAPASRLSNLRRFVPSASLINAKHALGLGAIGLAWYFGNTQVANVVAKTGYALPEIVANNPALPVGVGAATRLIVEAPQLLVRSIVAAGSGIAGLCKASKAKWDARKAPKPAVTAQNAGSAQISQLAAVLEQPEDSSSSAEIPTSIVQVPAFDKHSAARAALRGLIPVKTFIPTAEPTKPTVH